MSELYAWQDGDKWKLSKFPKPNEGEKPRPANVYDAQADCVKEASARGLKVTWLPQ